LGGSIPGDTSPSTVLEYKIFFFSVHLSSKQWNKNYLYYVSVVQLEEVSEGLTNPAPFFWMESELQYAHLA
jgi:hypothetical protein